MCCNEFGVEPKGLSSRNLSSMISDLEPGTPNADSLWCFVDIVGEAAATASATATDLGTEDESITVGGKIYTIVASADPEEAEISKGADQEEYAANIVAKINEDTADTLCTAEIDGDDARVFHLTANDVGEAGNDIPFATTDPNLTIDAEFGGGVTGSETLKSADRSALLTPSIRPVTGETDEITAADNNGIVTYDCSDPCAVTFSGDVPIGFNCLWIDIGSAPPTFSGAFVNRAGNQTSAGTGAIGSIVSPDGNLYLGGDLTT